jgi:NADH:ubiquinone oxidoreductase subunit F (NADH-binding)
LTNGLYDQPTLVSNVETFAWAPSIYLNGGNWYANFGVNGWKGARLFSVCGDLSRPGVYEVPMGLTVRELLEEYCGGMKAGKPLRAFAPSGPSGGFLPPKIPKNTLPRDFENRIKWWPAFAERHKLAPGWTHLDVLDLELDLQMFRDLGLMLGAGMVVYGQGTDVVSQGVNALEFYRNESCGKCVPCRIGSQKLVEIGTRLVQREYQPDEWDATGKLVQDLGGTMEQTAICGLGAVASAPLTSLIRYFPQDVQRCVSRVSRPAAPSFPKDDDR